MVGVLNFYEYTEVVNHFIDESIELDSKLDLNKDLETTHIDTFLASEVSRGRAGVRYVQCLPQIIFL